METMMASLLDFGLDTTSYVVTLSVMSQCRKQLFYYPLLVFMFLNYQYYNLLVKHLKIKAFI